tara:strand:+ start:1168 stop:1569 length:402 start_codon:yes stop_codon:yes gene_type:complete
MNNKSKKILSEISPGELLDKISILEIKLVKIKDQKSLEKINKEYESLIEAKKLFIPQSKKLDDLINKIKEVNLSLWNIEDKIRICEKNKDFGKEFVELARGVYYTNDKRSKIKSDINDIFDSDIREIKQYVDY